MVLGPGYTTDQSRGTGGEKQGDSRSNRKRRADQDHGARRAAAAAFIAAEAQPLLGNRQARSSAVLSIGGFRRRGRRAGLEAGLGGRLRATIGRPPGGGGAACAEAPEQPEGVGTTAGLGAGSGGGVAQEERARAVGGAGGAGVSARGGGTREAAVGAAGLRGVPQECGKGAGGSRTIAGGTVTSVTQGGDGRPASTSSPTFHRALLFQCAEVFSGRGRGNCSPDPEVKRYPALSPGELHRVLAHRTAVPGWSSWSEKPRLVCRLTRSQMASLPRAGCC